MISNHINVNIKNDLFSNLIFKNNSYKECPIEYFHLSCIKQWMLVKFIISLNI